MLKSVRDPHNPFAACDDHVVLFPTWPADDTTVESPAQPANHSVEASRVRVRTRPIRQVVVLEVTGHLNDVVQDLDRTIQHALAEGPRGVVCNLSGMLEGVEPTTVEALATAGRHVRDWSGIPVAIACPDPQVRAALAAHPLGGQLIVTASMLPALSAVLETETLVRRLQLHPHPTAPRASREFVTSTMIEWGLDPLVLAASYVVSELVTTTLDADIATDINLTVAWHLGALRLSVRESSPHIQRQPDTKNALLRQEQGAVVSLSRAFGVLPTDDGGKVVWAVLNAAKPDAETRPTPLVQAVSLPGNPLLYTGTGI